MAEIIGWKKLWIEKTASQKHWISLLSSSQSALTKYNSTTRYTIWKFWVGATVAARLFLDWSTENYQKIFRNSWLKVEIMFVNYALPFWCWDIWVKYSLLQKELRNSCGAPYIHNLLFCQSAVSFLSFLLASRCLVMS